MNNLQHIYSDTDFFGSVLKQYGEYLRVQPKIFHKVYLTDVNAIAKGFEFLEDIFFLVSCQLSGKKSKNNQLEKRSSNFTVTNQERYKPIINFNSQLRLAFVT